MNAHTKSIAARTIARRLCTALVLSAPVWLGGLSRAEAGVDVWTATGPYGGTVQSLAIDPQNPTTLYASVEGVAVNGVPTVDGVLKSTDGGANWSAVNTGLSILSVVSLTIDPQAPTTLYAGTAGSGVFKSTDGGGTWAAVNSGLPTSILSVMALALDPQTPTTLYAGTFRDGVFKSTDGAATWSAVNTGLTNTRRSVKALAIDPQTPTTMYVGVD